MTRTGNAVALTGSDLFAKYALWGQTEKQCYWMKIFNYNLR